LTIEETSLVLDPAGELDALGKPQLSRPRPHLLVYISVAHEDGMPVLAQGVQLGKGQQGLVDPILWPHHAGIAEQEALAAL
jgi:hypothetical protein